MIRSLALLALLAGCATVEPRACFSPEWEWSNYRAKIEHLYPGVVWVELTVAERDRFIEVMNTQVLPLTGAMYDRIGYFRKPGAPGVIVAHIVGECVWIAGPGYEGMVRAMIRPKDGA